MLINEAINNRDDHLRNFSFLQSVDGLELAPAYDLVPSDTRGAYPQLTFADTTRLPRPGSDEAMKAAKAFQLTAAEAREINERTVIAMDSIQEIMDDCGMAETDRRFFRSIVRSGVRE